MVFELIVASGSDILSLSISSQPESTVVILWIADDLSLYLSEVHGVVFDLRTDRILTFVLGVGLASDQSLLLLVVLNFEVLPEFDTTKVRS